MGARSAKKVGEKGSARFDIFPANLVSAQYLRKLRNGKITIIFSIFDKKVFFAFLGRRGVGIPVFGLSMGHTPWTRPRRRRHAFSHPTPEKSRRGFFSGPFFAAGNGELEEEEVYGCPLE